MDFNFPTMIDEPLIRLDYLKIPAKTSQKILEEKLSELFKKSKSDTKFYLATITEKNIEVKEFTNECFIVVSMDILIECYYDPLGNVHLSYYNFNTVKFNSHIEQIKAN